MLTKGQYERLKKYDRNLKMAVLGNCFSGMFRADTELLIHIYNDQYRESKKYTTCNHCILEMLQRLGKEYIAYEKQAELDAKNEEVEQSTATAPNKPKKGRKMTK